MSTCQSKMSQGFSFGSIIPSNSGKPSNFHSGLDTQQLNTSSLPNPAKMDIEVLVKTHAEDTSSPGPETPKTRVIVVGAGISGLRAASVLERHGLNVVVLEGRDRLGGRICTSRKEGKPARDIGAAWMHETSQNKLVKLISKLGIEYYYDDGTPLYYTSQGRAGSQFKAKKVADEFADYVEWYYTVNPDAEDKSVDDFMQDFIEQHELINEDERLWAPQVVKEVEQWLGTSTSQASAKHLSYFVTERNLYMKGGYDSIVNWTAEPLRKHANAIRLNHVVTHVDWSETGPNPVSVRCKTGNEVQTIVGDAIVITTPLGTFHHKLISFEPPLPNDIQHGINNFSYGALGKIFFEFSEVFWSKSNDQIIYYPEPGTNGNNNGDGASLASSPSSSSDESVDNILNYATVTVNLTMVADTKELCIQIVEPLTQRIEAMTDPKELYKFFEPLFKIIRTEPYKALPRVLNIETTRWTQDPLAGFGTYSIEKVGDNPELLLGALENHKDSRLQFAGEHLIRAGVACVHGAFASGEEAAVKLLNTLGIQCDGGDLVSIK